MRLGAFTGKTRAVSIAIAAALFVLYIDLSNEYSVWLQVTDRPWGMRLMYGAFFLVTCVFLTAIWAHAPLRSPVLLVSGALFVPLCVADALARRKRARKVAVHEDQPDLIAAK